MTDAAVFALITKSTEMPDGSLLVRGTATDPSLDADAQRCDPAWLKSAMPDWFRYGNIREQHSNIAAGVATHYEVEEGDRHVIEARIVDPGSVAKVKAGVLKGFSIGIRNPQIRADKSAPGGIIQNGQIVEVSIVDRPSNGRCTLTLAKSARPGMSVTADSFDPDSKLVRVEEYVEKSDTPEALAPPVEAEPTEPVTPEVPAADDALVVPVVGADTDVPVVPAGEGEAAGASVTPEAVEAEPVAAEAVPEPVAAPEPVVAPVEATPVEEPAVKAAALDEAAIRDLVTKSVAEAVAAHLQAAPVAVLDAEAVVEPVAAPVVKAAGPKGDTAAAVAFLTEAAVRLNRPDLAPDVTKGIGTHDPAFLASVRNGLLSCIVAEATEAMTGEDETWDIQVLLESLRRFLLWWGHEAEMGEVPASKDVSFPALDGDGMPLAAMDDTDLSGGVVLERSADADVSKAATPSEGCGCCDKCTHAVKAATPSPVTPPPAPPVAIAVEAEHGPELVDLPKGTTVTTKAVALTDTPEGVTETPAEAGSKTATPDTTKAALAEAMEPVLTEVRALRAENDTLLARLGRVEKAAAPGGPVRVRPVTADQAARAGDEFRAKAAALRQVGRTVDDPGLAAEYERRALAFEAKAVESGQVRAVTA